MNKSHDNHGFTLIELIIAIAISAIVMVAVSTSFMGILDAQQRVSTQTESTEAGARIINLLQRDLDGLWHHNIKKNKVFVGRQHQIAGFPADKMDFLTTTDSSQLIPDTMEKQKRSSICEVGYWLKPNPDTPGLMQLWRREDPLVDDEITTEGSFQLIHDRVREFNVTYYETLGRTAEEINEWDSSTADELPQVIKIEFSLERKIASRNQVRRAKVDDLEGAVKKYTQFIVLPLRMKQILKPGIALVPVWPGKPQPTEESGGNSGTGAGAGAGAGGGRGGGKGGGRGNQSRGNAEDSLRQNRDGSSTVTRRDGSVTNQRSGGNTSSFFNGGNTGNQNLSLGELFRQFGGGTTGGRK